MSEEIDRNFHVSDCLCYCYCFFFVIVFHLAVEDLVLYILTQQILPSIVALRQLLMKKVKLPKNEFRSKFLCISPHFRVDGTLYFTLTVQMSSFRGRELDLCLTGQGVCV